MQYILYPNNNNNAVGGSLYPWQPLANYYSSYNSSWFEQRSLKTSLPLMKGGWFSLVQVCWNTELQTAVEGVSFSHPLQASAEDQPCCPLHPLPSRVLAETAHGGPAQVWTLAKAPVPLFLLAAVCVYRMKRNELSSSHALPSLSEGSECRTQLWRQSQRWARWAAGSPTQQRRGDQPIQSARRQMTRALSREQFTDNERGLPPPTPPPPPKTK